MEPKEGRDEELLKDISRTLPFSLQGAATDILPFDEYGGLLLPPDASVSLVTTLTQIAEPCVLYRAIDGIISKSSARGLFGQALFSGIRASLRSYLALISVIEQKLLETPAALGLAATIALLQSPTMYLRLFRTLLLETVDSSTSIINVVYNYTLHGDPLISTHATELYNEVLEPFRTLLSQWENFGSLDNDVFNEMFVKPVEPHSFELVGSRVPRFMSLGEAQRSFERGKAVYFIRVVCNREDYDGANKSDAEILEYTHQLLMQDNDLLLHFRGLRDYMLLCNGNFVDALFRNDTSNFLMQPLGSVSQYLASEFFISTIDDLGADKLEDSRVLKCIDAYILGMNTANEDRLVWEAFIGKYQLVSEPLRMIIDAGAYRKYQRAFATLWRVRLAVYSLTESAIRLRLLAGSSSRGQQLNEVHIIMNSTFLRVQEHLYYSVIAQQWSMLEARLSSEKQLSLNDIKAAHTRYIDSVAAVVNLGANVQAIQTMARLALGLQRVLEELELEMTSEESPEAGDVDSPQIREIAEAFESVAAKLVLSM